MAFLERHVILWKSLETMLCSVSFSFLDLKQKKNKKKLKKKKKNQKTKKGGSHVLFSK
jgi:hypothetical protein